MSLSMVLKPDTPGLGGEPLRQMTAVNTNAENDLDGAFGTVLGKRWLTLNGPKEKYREGRTETSKQGTVSGQMGNMNLIDRG